jgi:hypothetical protein
VATAREPRIDLRLTIEDMVAGVIVPQLAEQIAEDRDERICNPFGAGRDKGLSCLFCGNEGSRGSSPNKPRTVFSLEQNVVMTADRARRHDDFSDEAIGRLYLSGGHTVADFVSTMDEEQRAAIATFCYGRNHFREIALAIAATCERASLVEAAGLVMGEILFGQSREQSGPAKQRQGSRKVVITLASVTPTEALKAAALARLTDEDDSEPQSPHASDHGLSEDDAHNN